MTHSALGPTTGRIPATGGGQRPATDAGVTWVVVDDHGGDADATGLPAPDLVVCADSGIVLAQRLGLSVDVLVGDLDSAPRTALVAAEARGTEVQRHPADKDATDLALALGVAAERTAAGGRVVVLAGAGGRLDHALANVHALADPVLAPHAVLGRLGTADVHVLRGERSLELAVGSTLTLLPSGGPVHGVTTHGLRYPLDDESLAAWTTRGVSNVVDTTPVDVRLTEGCLLAIVPRAAGGHADGADDAR